MGRIRDRHQTLKTALHEALGRLPVGETIVTREGLRAASINAQSMRSKFEGTKGPQSVLLGINCKFLDKYGPTQRAELTSIAITVWHPTGLTTSLRTEVPMGTKIEERVLKAIRELAKQVLAECSHLRTEHVATTGNCLNRYKCLDCGAIFDIDSSG